MLAVPGSSESTELRGTELTSNVSGWSPLLVSVRVFAATASSYWVEARVGGATWMRDFPSAKSTAAGFGGTVTEVLADGL